MIGYRQRARRELVSVMVLIVLGFVVALSLIVPLMPVRAVTNHTVGMYDFNFNQQFLTVAPGDTVTWHNYGTVIHTSTSNTSEWPQVSLSPGGTSAAVTMPTTPGNYTYHCLYHSGAPFYMYGAIIVSNSIPEFSGSFVVVVGMLVMALGLMLARRRL